MSNLQKAYFFALPTKFLEILVLHGDDFKDIWSLNTEVIKPRKNLQIVSAANLSKIHVKAKVHLGDFSSDAMKWAEDERFPYWEVSITFSMNDPFFFPLWFEHSDCCINAIGQSKNLKSRCQNILIYNILAQ